MPKGACWPKGVDRDDPNAALPLAAGFVKDCVNGVCDEVCPNAPVDMAPENPDAWLEDGKGVLDDAANPNPAPPS